MTPPVLLLASKRCDQCLTTRGRIVTGARAASIVRECRAAQKHFVCHKGSEAGLNLHCRGVHEIAPSLAYRLAIAWNIEVQQIDPESLQP